MVKSTRSIKKRVSSQKGQRQLALFLLMASCGLANAHEVGGEIRHISSSQLFYKEDWADRGIRTDAKKVAASLNASIGSAADVADFRVELAAKYKMYYTGSENVLFIAALSETDNKFRIPSQNGSYSLNAAFHMLQSRQLTISKEFQWNDRFKLKLSPHVFTIEDYQYGKARGALDVEGANAYARGTLERVGTRQYGFLLNEKDDRGWGWGLDVSGQAHWENWQVDFAVNNLLNQMRFSTVHYSDRLYNVHAVDGEIQIKQNRQFSMTGEYGHRTSVERLPIQTEIAVRYTPWASWMGGIYSVGDQVVPWLAYEVRKGSWVGRATTMQFENLMLDMGWAPWKHVQLGLGVTFNKEWRPRVGMLQAKLVW